MQRLEVSGAVRPIYGSLGVKRLASCCHCSGDNSVQEIGRIGSRQEECKIHTKLWSGKPEGKSEIARLHDASQHVRFIA